MNADIKKWLEIGKEFARHPPENYRCPFCNKGILRFEDIWGATSTDAYERHVFCDDCHRENYIRLRINNSGEKH